MNRLRSALVQLGFVLAVAVMLLADPVLLTRSPASAAPSPRAIIVRVLRVSPTTPAASVTPQPLTITLSLVNTIDRPYRVTVEAMRGNPISSQAALDDAIARPQAPDPAQAGNLKAVRPATATLGPLGNTELSYVSTSDTLNDGGLCICQTRVYPLYFTAHAVLDGADTVLGSTQTFVPGFAARPQPVKVSWVWPLLERPHRLLSDTVFIDDELAESVATGGRLDRMMQVVERVGRTVPMTLVVDPDLIDELQVMSTGNYRVLASGGHTVPGTGAADAAAWLARLREVLGFPDMELALTPSADPDVESLMRGHLSWSLRGTGAAQARIGQALRDIVPAHDIAWPAGETLSTNTLAALVQQGVHTVLLNDRSLPGARPASPTPDALAPLHSTAGPVVAAVSSSTLNSYVGQVLAEGGPGETALPLLVSELAVRAVAEPQRSHYVVLAAPRDLDPDPAVAAAAILATAHAPWSVPLPLRAAADGAVRPVGHGSLVPQRHAGLAESTIDTAHYVSGAVPVLSDLIALPADRATLLGPLPTAAQRTASAEWTGDSAGAVAVLREHVKALKTGVHLAVPTTGTYTLGSSESPLPITVANTLPADVQVRLQIDAVGGLPGFSAGNIGVQRIAAGHTVQLRVPVHIERAGRIKVQVALLTSDASQIGRRLQLSVRSTALGEIGKIITIVAGVVLALALLVRVVRRWRKPPAPPPGAQTPLVSHGAELS